MPHALGASRRDASALVDPFALTAKTDSSFCRSSPEQDGQLGDSALLVRYSKW
jgi:hypothetical protein